MPASDSLLFIDANKYLDLYRTEKGKLILDALREQSDHIFITRQVIDEVKRNRIKVVIEFLTNKFKELKFQPYNVPDHLFGSTEEQSRNILGKMKTIGREIREVNQELYIFALGIMEKVSQSKDEVSATLAPIFAKQVPHTETELQRARERRRVGNPPGKRADPIGDQLSWEQILSRFIDKKKLWIVSRDGDYGTMYEGRGFVNQFLYEELLTISSNAEVFLFDDIPSGIKHFAEKTGVKADNLPTPEEIEEIKNEERKLSPLYGLPPLDWSDLEDPAVRAFKRQLSQRRAVFTSATDTDPGTWISSFLPP